MGAENRGRQHDEEAVLAAVNFALAMAEQPERFLVLQSRPKRTQYLFADPAQLRPLAEKYALPVQFDQP